MLSTDVSTKDYETEEGKVAFTSWVENGYMVTVACYDEGPELIKLVEIPAEKITTKKEVPAENKKGDETPKPKAKKKKKSRQKPKTDVVIDGDKSVTENVKEDGKSAEEISVKE